MRLRDIVIIVIFLTFGYVYISCSGNKSSISNDIEIINIDYKNITSEKLYIDEFVEDSKILLLEANDNCLIAEISKIIINDNRIYIVDQNLKAIFLFDMNGKFLKKINAIGRAGNEYLGITDVEIINEKLFIFDHMTGKLLSYRKDDFSFLSSQFINSIWGNNILNINDNLFFINNRSGSDLGSYFIYKMNDNNDFTCYLPFSENINTWSLDQYCVKEDSCGYFYFTPFDTIYQYNDDKAFPKYFINFGKNKMPENIITDDAEEALLASFKSEKIRGINKFIPLGSKLLITYDNNKGNYFTIYEKETLNTSTYNNVLSEKYAFPLNQVSRIDQYLVSNITANSFVFYYDNTNIDKLDSVNYKLINDIKESITELSNPVIFFAKVVDEGK